ncbi:hypothetical protein [Ruegeria arenilitoris]|uniref:hypothetical protein n=1 Tax=Ruegeria arenilitoris TaxID=1173585 RepID=UPI00147D938F|nr:hypothetical protein [Ruegeria arenilitoris]
MFVIKNYVTTCGTVACALAIGYLMQNGPNAQHKGATIQHASVTNESSVIPGLESVVLTSTSPADTESSVTSPANRTIRAKPTDPQQQVDCNLSARAVAAPQAAARLTLKAPCKPSQNVELHHSGMTFTARTDEDGRIDLTIPVLSEYAIFLISFEDNAGTVATTHVPDFAAYNRVALQWRGNTELQLHALEFGASYGEAGHVWANPQAQGVGNVVHLGVAGSASAHNVELYTFPAGQTDQNGEIALTVEAEVTEANCGRELSVQSLEIRADRRLRSRDLTLPMPDCSADQNFLVLNNLFEDLTIAAK